MKLGKPHLVGSLALVVASLAYNVWVYTRPPERSTSASDSAPLMESVSNPGPVVTGERAVAAVDPTTLPAPPDVELARAPQWSRNPFQRAPPFRVEVVATPAIDIIDEPDMVVASILHSPQRRLAVVNGRIVGAGDRVGGSTILEIQPRAIVVESSRGVRRTVELHFPLTTRGVK